MPKKKTARLTLVLPSEVHEAAKRAAELELISLAAWLRRVVREAAAAKAA